MNQFLRSFLLLSLLATAGQLTLHATAHDGSVDEADGLYSITVEHGYKNDPKKTIHISAHYMRSLIFQCVEAIVKNSGTNSKYAQYSIKLTCSYQKTGSFEFHEKTYDLLINFADFLAVQYISDDIANQLCNFFGFSILQAQLISKEAFAYYQNKKQIRAD